MHESTTVVAVMVSFPLLMYSAEMLALWPHSHYHRSLSMMSHLDILYIATRQQQHLYVEQV